VAARPKPSVAWRLAGAGGVDVQLHFGGRGASATSPHAHPRLTSQSAHVDACGEGRHCTLTGLDLGRPRNSRRPVVGERAHAPANLNEAGRHSAPTSAPPTTRASCRRWSTVFTATGTAPANRYNRIISSHHNEGISATPCLHSHGAHSCNWNVNAGRLSRPPLQPCNCLNNHSHCRMHTILPCSFFILFFGSSPSSTLDERWMKCRQNTAGLQRLPLSLEHVARARGDGCLFGGNATTVPLGAGELPGSGLTKTS